MTESGDVVRAAHPADATALARAHVRAWQATYRGLMPDDFLDELDPVERGEWWATSLAAPRPGTSTLVAAVGDSPDDVVGFAVVGAVRDSDADVGGADADETALGELFAINLDPAHWGRGLGRRLLAAATDELRQLGFGEAILWVATGNARARRFYEVAGWSADGTERVETAFGPPIDETRYHRLLPT